MSHGLTEDQIADLQASFDLFDIDGSGSISGQELKQVMRRFGQAPSDKDVQEMIDRVDKNGDNEIDFNEFIELMRHRIANNDPDFELKLAFEAIDTDNSGTISVEELKGLMAKVNQHLSEEEIIAIMSEVDLDGNKELDFGEFKEMMTY